MGGLYAPNDDICPFDPQPKAQARSQHKHLRLRLRVKRGEEMYINASAFHALYDLIHYSLCPPGVETT